jgi:hypothetical protein
MERCSSTRKDSSVVNVSAPSKEHNKLVKQTTSGLNKGFKPHLVFGLSFNASVFAPGDPQSPCKSCWEKYAQPYTREMEVLDWNDTANSHYQKPISRAGNHVNLSVSQTLLDSVAPDRIPGPIINSRLEYETPDDGKPTVSPCSGHPLLRNGHVLIYPHGFKCDKCKYSIRCSDSHPNNVRRLQQGIQTRRYTLQLSNKHVHIRTRGPLQPMQIVLEEFWATLHRRAETKRLERSEEQDLPAAHPSFPIRFPRQLPSGI